MISGWSHTLNMWYITKASSGGALAGVSVYFRRNISSGGGGGRRPKVFLRGFWSAFLEALLWLTFGGLQKRSQAVQSAIGVSSWCLEPSQDSIKSVRNSFSEAFPVRTALDIHFQSIIPLNFYFLRLQNYWKYIRKIIVLSSSRISNIVRKYWLFGFPKSFILSISNHPN